MTTTYDPGHPRYLDQADVRGELSRSFDICNGCRRCVELCDVFPTLFELLDVRRDAGLLTPAEQDDLVDACFQCMRCALDCPYLPGAHEWELDVPRLMLRARAMQHRERITPARRRATSRTTARSDRLGRMATAGRLGNRIANARPGSGVRKVVEKLTGVSSVRLLAPYARQRFSTWFDQRVAPTLTEPQARVTVFPTCIVEYQQTAVGKDLVGVYERNGIECTRTAAGCCGAPWLHSGDVAEFAKVAARNVAVLAAEVRGGTDIVVPQPTCSYVIEHEYPRHVGGSDAELVATHTYDAAEYLMRVHAGEHTDLDTDFTGEVPDTITYHAPCHLRAHGIGLPGRDLMALTGADVHVVERCSGVDGAWGLRAGNEEVSLRFARGLGAEIDRAGDDRVAGDCGLANTAILEQTGRQACHPLQVVARAYGIPEE